MADKESVDDETDPLANPRENSEYDKNPAIKRPGGPSVLPPHFPAKVAKGPLDEPSRAGKFGWCELAGIFLPTILRWEYDKFLSVRMVEKVLISRFLQLLPYEVVTCPIIHSYRVTEVEARLLNEINAKHSDCLFGKDNFTTKDLVVRKYDVEQFYLFLDSCFSKMILKKSTEKDKCGFLRIGGTSDVPYVEVGGSKTKYMPVFYFEGEIDLQKCVTLRGWDWAYLKFCCKVQGVKDQLIASDVCKSVSLEDLREYFPPGTTFVEYWPAKDFVSRVMSKKSTQSGSWTRVITNPEGGKFVGRLTLIKEFPLHQTAEAPYRALKASVESKIVTCINIRPYQFKDVMVTLPHLVEQLFPSLTEEQVGDMMVSQGVALYKGNKGQTEVIKQEGWQDKYEQVPLVTMKDILPNMQSFKNAVKAADFGGKRTQGT